MKDKIETLVQTLGGALVLLIPIIAFIAIWSEDKLFCLNLFLADIALIAILFLIDMGLNDD